VDKIAEKAVCRIVFLATWKNVLLQTVFFGDFAHWVSPKTLSIISIRFNTSITYIIQLYIIIGDI